MTRLPRSILVLLLLLVSAGAVATMKGPGTVRPAGAAEGTAGILGTEGASGATGSQEALVPVDEAGRDPGLLTFRSRLLRALAEGDVEAAAGAADPEIRVSLGMDYGRESFRERLQDPEYRGELAAVLGLGGVFTGDSTFVAPYTFQRFPDGYDPFECYAVVGRDVRVRAAPDPDAEILGLLTYEAVCHPPSQRTGRDGFVPIGLEDGGTGYVAERFLRSPIDYRAGLEKKGGRWWLVTFIAGD